MSSVEARTNVHTAPRLVVTAAIFWLTLKIVQTANSCGWPGEIPGAGVRSLGGTGQSLLGCWL